jgi:succinyl-diaminopimelate desuccinylase
MDAARAALAADIVARRDQVVALARRLIAVPSPNPPGATGPVAEAAEAAVREAVPDADTTLHATGEGVVNLVARLRGNGPGPRVVFNGHLDTFPLGEDLGWTVDPLGGLVRDGRLHGRGAAEMKGGIACSIAALAALAAHRGAWPGEAVLTLAGDEESMGPRGTKWLLDHVPHARGDAVLIGDAGSPRALRFGEKGFLWIAIEATGKPAHGAHLHLGANAIDRLRAALDALDRLCALAPEAPASVLAAIEASRPISEPLSGAGEAAVLRAVTVNIGRIEGGVSTNLVPAAARASADIRLPVGVPAARAEAALAEALGTLPGITWRIERRFEPNHTDPAHPAVRLAAAAAAEVLGGPVAVNMRVGGSDAR